MEKKGKIEGVWHKAEEREQFATTEGQISLRYAERCVGVGFVSELSSHGRLVAGGLPDVRTAVARGAK